MMDIKLLKKAYDKHIVERVAYNKMERYYRGETDAIRDYKMLTTRSKNITPTNFIQNFIDEEVSYSVGNDATYVSRSGNQEATDTIAYHLTGLSGAHDINLLEAMLITSLAYELYYIDWEDNFAARVISASDGKAILDSRGGIKYFLHLHKSLDEDGLELVDVYDKDYIYYCDKDFNQVKPRKRHIFGEVPVGIATYDVYRDSKHKTIYNTIKGLQDAYETNLSDISNEISDFRNAYLAFMGNMVDNDDLPKMKELGIIQINSGEVKWLIKDINDSFIQNTLLTMEEKMYQLTKHINHNEKLQASTSGLAIKSRMIGLQQKCKLNQKAITDCISMRLKMLFKYVEFLKGDLYDYKDIKVVFSANLPSDDVVAAEMINKLGDKLSLETALSELSFIEDPAGEVERILKEQEKMFGGSLLDE